MAVVITYRCPMCDNNVQPWLGLITKPAIQCSQCKLRLNVTRDMVVANWARNLYLWGVLVIWVVFSFYAMAAQGATSEVGPIGLAIGLLIIGWFPGVIFALPLIPVGMIVGAIMARRLCTEQRPPLMPEGKPGGYVPQEHDWR